MELTAPVFEAMNETDVREEVIAPLIARLGYRTGTEHNAIRELGLSYDRLQLGRTKPTDPPVRGKADYVLEAGKRVRWVLEAKAPSAPLDASAAAQAWSYANHPEVRAVYYLVTNGRRFRLYRTNRGASSEPVMEFAFEDIETRFAAINNTLGPAGILRDFPEIEIDYGDPLGPGLRSNVRISSGRLRVERLEPPIAPVHMMNYNIVDGSASRRPEGGIAVYYRTEVGVALLQEMNEKIGLNVVCLLTEDDTLSTDPSKPTMFRAVRELVVPKGTTTIDINTWQPGEAPVDIRMHVKIEASGSLTAQEFGGTFRSEMKMTMDLPQLGLIERGFVTIGNFQLSIV